MTLELEPKTEAPKRTKPSDVAMAEHHAWRLGWQAAEKLAQACLEARHDLLERGFPSSHALCEEIDQDTARWAAHATQMRRDMIAHAKLNQIEL
jgi:hypothetical protein